MVLLDTFVQSAPLTWDGSAPGTLAWATQTPCSRVLHSSELTPLRILDQIESPSAGSMKSTTMRTQAASIRRRVSLNGVGSRLSSRGQSNRASRR
jgi:hypothetical protein